MLLLQTARRDFSLAVDKAGKSSVDKSAVMATTTINSTRVKPAALVRRAFPRFRAIAIRVRRLESSVIRNMQKLRIKCNNYLLTKCNNLVPGLFSRRSGLTPGL